MHAFVVFSLVFPYQANCESVLHFSLVARKIIQVLSTKMCPIVAEITEDNSLLKNDFLAFQGTVVTFYREGGQQQNSILQVFP